MQMPKAARDNAYPWAVLLAFVGVSAWANSLHAPDQWALRAVAALVPVSAALCWHLLVRPGLADGWRRLLSRAVALGVFAYTMWASFGSLTAVGRTAGLTPPEALPVAFDGLAIVAALSVWTHVHGAVQQQSAGLDTAGRDDLDATLAGLRAEMDRLAQSRSATVGQDDLDSLRSSVLDEVQSRLDKLPQPSPQSKRPAAAKSKPVRSPEYTEAVQLLRASGVVRTTAYARAGAAEKAGRLGELIAELRTPRGVA